MPELKKDLIFARFWDYDDHIEKSKRKAAKCAEVLIPTQISYSYIVGIFVSCELTKKKVVQEFPQLEIEVNRDMFFL